MLLRLTAETNTGLVIIFDPAGLPANEVYPFAPIKTLESVTATGQAICYDAAMAGSYDFFVLIDESPQPELLSRRCRAVENMHLRLPSGRLIATGLEDICRDLKDRYSPDRFEPKMGQAASLPVGNYAVDAFDVDWGEEVELTISAQARRGDQAIETGFGIVIGVDILGTLLVVPLLLVGTWWKSGIVAALWLAAWIAGFEGLFWGVTVSFLKVTGAWKRMTLLRERVESEHPSTVLVFRTLGDGQEARKFNVGRFGE